jgi:predicted transcriptional regulator YheO
MGERKAIFNILKQLADAVVKTFGRSCEVAVHDFSDLNKSLVYLAGDVTGRKQGAPITDLVVKALHRDGKNIKDRYNYKTTTKDGRSIKSSTIFIRNSAGDVIGGFCTNIDTTDLLNAGQVLQQLVRTRTFKVQESHETFAATIGETIEALFGQAVSAVGKQPATMSTEEKIELVKVLENKGAFQIKRAVDQVAILVGVSKYTIYNYLQKVRATQAINQF